MPEGEIAQGARLLELVLEYVPTTATGRAAIMMTGTAAIFLSALFSLLTATSSGE